MINSAPDYTLFFQFIEKYAPAGFKSIDPNDPLMIEIEEIMEENDQFFYIADIIQLKVIFTSKRSIQMMGIEPADLSPYHFMEAAHPDDIQRLNLGRAKIIKLAQELYIAEKGFTIMSTNFKIRNPAGGYSNLLIQGYLFYTQIPYKTVFFLKIHTSVDWFRKMKYGYHYYIGNDMSYFKYPDDELLMIGNIFTDREFEIIRLIESGLSTEQIADQLFVSPHTISTHRRNILEKAGKLSLADVIYDLKERGLL